jgi:hypothetical protein
MQATGRSLKNKSFYKTFVKTYTKLLVVILSFMCFDSIRCVHSLAQSRPNHNKMAEPLRDYFTALLNGHTRPILVSDNARGSLRSQASASLIMSDFGDSSFTSLASTESSYSRWDSAPTKHSKQDGAIRPPHRS